MSTGRSGTSEAPLALRDLARCFQGGVPGVIATASDTGEPNITYLSRVRQVDDERVGGAAERRVPRDPAVGAAQAIGTRGAARDLPDHRPSRGSDRAHISRVPSASWETAWSAGGRHRPGAALAARIS